MLTAPSMRGMGSPAWISRVSRRLGMASMVAPFSGKETARRILPVSAALHRLQWLRGGMRPADGRTTREGESRLLRPKRALCLLDILYAQHQPGGCRQIGEMDVDPGVGEAACDVAQFAGAIFQLEHEDILLPDHRDFGDLQGASCLYRVVHKDVDHSHPLEGDAADSVDVHAGLA